MKTKISWTDEVWNPVTGCTKCSPGCENCYAEVMARRLSKIPTTAEKYKNGFDVTCHDSELNRKFSGKGKKIFICSMGDLFHKDVPFEFIDCVMAVIAINPQHTFQILTKRPERMKEYFTSSYHQRRNINVYNTAARFLCSDFSKMPGDMARTRSSGGTWWPLKNLWLGVTIESDEQWGRFDDYLDKIPAAKKFISVEPMLGPIDMRNGALPDWVICGGESGKNARPLNPDWVISLRDQCQTANVPFFFKQWGEFEYDRVSQIGCIYDPKLTGYRPINKTDMIIGNYVYTKPRSKKSGNRLHGQTYEQFPEVK